MTAIHVSHLLAPATTFERLLLRTAAQLDHVVAVRVERRAKGIAAPGRAVAPASSPRSTICARPSSALDVHASSTLLAPVSNQLR